MKAFLDVEEYDPMRCSHTSNNGASGDVLSPGEAYDDEKEALRDLIDNLKASLMAAHEKIADLEAERSAVTSLTWGAPPDEPLSPPAPPTPEPFSMSGLFGSADKTGPGPH